MGCQQQLSVLDLLAPYFKLEVGMNDEVQQKNGQYSDLIITDVQYHSNSLRKPKEWYPEMVRVAERGTSGSRIYTNSPVPFLTEDGRVGLELRFPITEKIAALYKGALEPGNGFKIFTLKSGIRIHPDKNAIEKINSLNKRAGFNYVGQTEFRGQLSTFDIKDGSVIMKVILLEKEPSKRDEGTTNFGS